MCIFLHFFKYFAYGFHDLVNFELELARRYSQRTLPKNYHLLRAVGGRNTDAVVARQLMRRLFDKVVGGLGLLGVDYRYIAVLFDLTVAFELLRVKDQNEVTVSKSLIVTHKIYQPRTRQVEVITRNLRKLVPGKNDVIAVHEQIFRAAVWLM